MISFISGTLSKEKPCCELLLAIYESFKHLVPVKHNTHRLANM